MDRLETIERVEEILKHSSVLQREGYSAEQILSEVRRQMVMLIDGTEQESSLPCKTGAGSGAFQEKGKANES